MAIMHYLKERPTWGLALLVLVCLFGPDDAQTEPGQESQLLTDRFGDPLPTGAVARLGTVRFRTGFVMYQVGFWPDGNFVAGASAGGGVGVWDVATGKEAHHYLGNRHVYAFAISPDGKSLACP